MFPADSSGSVCPSCGAHLDLSLLGGSCPACLFTGIISVEKKELSSQNDFPEIEGYEILEEIGHGGMGVVYRATQESPAREVALKIVAPYSLRASQARERFLVEVETMASVEHPGLLPLYDAGEDDFGRPWLTMQLAEGGTLAERVNNYQGDWKASARLVQRLCEAIYFAHERGILHRDLKPANILFDQEGHPFVADFGLAKWAEGDGKITQSSTMLGSPAYLAPEAARGGSKVTTTVSDVYGLGAILYELLVGSKPYDGEVASEVLTKILDGSPIAPRKRLKNIPRDLEVIVMKAMAREPEKRYFSAAAFAEDLGLWLAGRVISARPVGLMERGIIWARRNPAVATLSFLFLASMVTGGILLWQSNKKLTASLDDAEARVDFMTRELPMKLEPLGRLDVLDDVFENVAEHYETTPSRGGLSLARHADFLTQWSQILRPRGQIRESVERLSQALEKAEEAVDHSPDLLEAQRARLLAGRRLGEALIEADRYDEARVILEATEDYTEGIPMDDLLLRVHLAELSLELVSLELAVGNLEAALALGLSSEKQWTDLKGPLEGEIGMERERLAAARAPYFIASTYQRMKREEDARRMRSIYHQGLEELVVAEPTNALFQYELVVAKLVIDLKSSDSLAQRREWVRDIDEEMRVLLIRDPANLTWRTTALNIAFKLKRFADEAQDTEASQKWLRETSRRVEPLGKLYASDFSFLKTWQQISAYCGEKLASEDWPSAKEHLTAAVELRIQMCRLDPSQSQQSKLKNGIGIVANYIRKEEGPDASTEWVTRVNQQVKSALK